MLDIIRDNLYFDFGFVHSESLDFLYSKFGDLIKTNSKSFASSVAALSNKYETLLAEVIEKYEGVS